MTLLMATASENNQNVSKPLLTNSNELSINQLVEKISRREELQSKYPYLAKIPADDESVSTNQSIKTVLLPKEKETCDPTHGSVKSRFSILPPIGPDEKSACSGSGSSEEFAGTETSVSLKDYVVISRSNSRACDCTSPCIHRIHEEQDENPLSEAETWIGNYKDEHSLHVENSNLNNLENQDNIISKETNQLAERSTPEPWPNDVNEIYNKESASQGTGLQAELAEPSAQVAGDTNAKIASRCGDLVDQDSKTTEVDIPSNLRTTGSHSKESMKQPVNLQQEAMTTSKKETINTSLKGEQSNADMKASVGILPSPFKEGESQKDRDGSHGQNYSGSVYSQNDNNTLPPIESGKSGKGTSPSNSKQLTTNKTTQKNSLIHETVGGKLIKKTDGPDSNKANAGNSSVNSSASDSVFKDGSSSLRSSSSGSGYVPSPHDGGPKRRLRKEAPSPKKSEKVPVITTRGFPQDNFQSSSEIPSTIPFRHRLQAVSKSDGAINGKNQQAASQHPKALFLDSPSVRDNIGQQHLKALKNNMEFTNSNAAVRGKHVVQGNSTSSDPLPRPVTVNGIVSFDRGSEFQQEEDSSIIDAVTKANTPRNALPGRFRYGKVQRKSSFSLKSIFKAGKRAKNNATADSPAADTPVKAKDDAWLGFNPDDVSYPAAYLARASSADDVSHYDLGAIDRAQKESTSKKESSPKASLLAKFKKMIKPKSKVHKFKQNGETQGEAESQSPNKTDQPSSGQDAVHVQNGSDFIGALLPEHSPNALAQMQQNQALANRQQQRPHFVRHMNKMKKKAREANRHSALMGQQPFDDDTSQEQDANSPAEKHISQEQFAQLQYDLSRKEATEEKIRKQQGKGSPPEPPPSGQHQQPQMYYVNVPGDRVLVVDPNRIPPHDQIVVDPNSTMMSREASGGMVWVPPNTPHHEMLDYYMLGDPENVQGQDKVLAIARGLSHPNTPLQDQARNPGSVPGQGNEDPGYHDGRDYLDPALCMFEGDIPPDLLAMVSPEQSWRAQDSMTGRRSVISRMATSLGVIKEEADEMSSCTSSSGSTGFGGDDEASETGPQRSEPDGESKNGSRTSSAKGLSPETNVDQNSDVNTGSKEACNGRNIPQGGTENIGDGELKQNNVEESRPKVTDGADERIAAVSGLNQADSVISDKKQSSAKGERSPANIRNTTIGTEGSDGSKKTTLLALVNSHSRENSAKRTPGEQESANNSKDTQIAYVEKAVSDDLDKSQLTEPNRGEQPNFPGTDIKRSNTSVASSSPIAAHSGQVVNDGCREPKDTTKENNETTKEDFILQSQNDSKSNAFGGSSDLLLSENEGSQINANGHGEMNEVASTDNRRNNFEEETSKENKEKQINTTIEGEATSVNNQQVLPLPSNDADNVASSAKLSVQNTSEKTHSPIETEGRKIGEANN